MGNKKNVVHDGLNSKILDEFKPGGVYFYPKFDSNGNFLQKLSLFILDKFGYQKAKGWSAFLSPSSNEKYVPLFAKSNPEIAKTLKGDRCLYVGFSEEGTLPPHNISIHFTVTQGINFIEDSLGGRILSIQAFYLLPDGEDIEKVKIPMDVSIDELNQIMDKEISEEREKELLAKPDDKYLAKLKKAKVSGKPIKFREIVYGYEKKYENTPFYMASAFIKIIKKGPDSYGVITDQMRFTDIANATKQGAGASNFLEAADTYTGLDLKHMALSNNPDDSFQNYSPENAMRYTDEILKAMGMATGEGKYGNLYGDKK